MHKHGCDINSLNCFGCNALLWCSQGAATPEIFSWLYSSGADFTLVNDNGHSALHKAAQRGNKLACKWLVDTFLLLDRNRELDGFLLIGPDAEGACPSDLCGMNGHDDLVEWLSKQECDYVRRYYNYNCLRAVNVHKACPDDKHLLENENIPTWLSHKTNGNGGINRMMSALTDCFPVSNPISNNVIKKGESQPQREQLRNLNEID